MLFTEAQNQVIRERFANVKPEEIRQVGTLARLKISTTTEVDISPDGSVFHYLILSDGGSCHHCDFEPARQIKGATPKYFLYGVEFTPQDWELLRKIHPHTKYANKNSPIDIHVAKNIAQTPIWNSPNLAEIISHLVQGYRSAQPSTTRPSIDWICANYSEEYILKWTQSSQQSFNDYFSPLKHWGFAVNMAQEKIIKKVIEYLKLDDYPKFQNGFGTIIVNGEHYFFRDGHYEHRPGGGALAVDQHNNPSLVTLDSKHWHISGKEVTTTQAEAFLKFSAFAHKIVGWWSEPRYYQLTMDDLAEFPDITKARIAAANMLSLQYFGHEHNAIKLIRLLGYDKIDEIISIHDAEKRIAAIDSILTPPTTAPVLPIAAAIAVTALVSGLRSHSRRKDNKNVNHQDHIRN